MLFEHRWDRRTLRLLSLTLAVLAAAALCVPLLRTAHAAEIDDKRAEAAALEAQIADNGRKLDALNEKINDAQIALDAATAAITEADAAVAAAQAKTAEIRAAVATRAADIYMRASDRGGLSSLDTTSARDLTTREKYTDVAGQRDKHLLTQLAKSREQLAEKKAAAESARTAAESQQAQIESVKVEVQAGDAKQRELLGKVNGDIADLVAKAEAERTAREAAEAAARLKLVPANNNLLASTSPPPAPSAKVGAVLAYAYAQLGKPYCYAGSGPSCFDCSGLTMMAWAQAGVSMSHGSNDQFASFPHVPLNQLQPGDLVFWDGHVGIYVGNSSVLHAPYTGTVVHITPIWGGVIGAARPG